MNEKSILEDIIFNKIALQNMNCKLNKKRKPETTVKSKWEYQIVVNTDDKLHILVNVNSVYTGLLQINASYLIKYDTKIKINIEDIRKNIGTLISYSGLQQTLLSSFITNCMIGMPLPTPPVIDDKDLSFKE
jgi:hypothetical protein